MRWLARGAVFAALVAAGLFVAGFLVFAWTIDHDEPVSPPRADAVVALTGGPQRLADGLLLLRQGQGRRMLISGVFERSGPEEIQRHYPVMRDLIQCCVDLGAQARNTIGNAIEARRWARQHGFRSLMVVTSNFHMPRVLLEFRHAMPDMELVPYPVAAENFNARRWWGDAGMTRRLFVEYVKYLAASARTLVEGDPETSRLAVIAGGRKPVSPKVMPGAVVGN